MLRPVARAIQRAVASAARIAFAAPRHYQVERLVICQRQPPGKGASPSIPLFFSAQVFPLSVDLYTPRPKAAAYKVRAPDGLPGSSTSE